MYKKLCISSIIVAAIYALFSFSNCFANNGMQDAVNGVRNVVGSAENAVENAGKDISNTSKDITGNMEKGANNMTNDIMHNNSMMNSSSSNRKLYSYKNFCWNKLYGNEWNNLDLAYFRYCRHCNNCNGLVLFCTTTFFWWLWQ